MFAMARSWLHIAAALFALSTGCVYNWEETWKRGAPDKDGGDADLEPPDARLDRISNDTASDLPIQLVTVRPQSNASFAPCMTDEIAVGGGGECPAPYFISRSRPPLSGPSDRWKIGCSSGAAEITYAVCLKTSVLGLSDAKIYTSPPTIGKQVKEQNCKKANRLLIGGGCACEGDNVKMMKSAPDDTTHTTWDCSCSETVPITAFSIGTNASLKIAVEHQPGTGKNNVTASCPGGMVALGGGCDGQVRQMIPLTSGFTCLFNQSWAAKAWVICLGL